MQGGVEDAYNQEPSTAQTPPALFSSKVVDVKKQNEPYIKEVVDASRSILDLALKGLRSEGSLKHAPVRTHFRILSGAMFLLKVSLCVGEMSCLLANFIVRHLPSVEKKMKSAGHSSCSLTSQKLSRTLYLTIAIYPFELQNSSIA